MSGTATPYVNMASGPLSSKRSRSCDAIYSSTERGRCCCNCLGCACRTNTEQQNQIGPQPIPCLTPIILNAYGPIQVNSVSSSESFPTQAHAPLSDSMPQTHFIGAPSLQLLSRSQAHRNERQMRQDVQDRFLEDHDDFGPRLFQEPQGLDDNDMTMPTSQFPMELDDPNGSGQADRRSSISMLSEYTRSFSVSNLSASGLLVGAGAVTNDGNRYLELTERRRHPGA